MEKNKRYLLSFVLTFLLICFVSPAQVSSSNGVESNDKPLADVVLGSSGVSLIPKVNYHRLVLTVSTPGGAVIRKTFETGSSPYFGLSDLSGASRLDGSYTYELQAIPFPRKRDRRELDTAGEFMPPQKSLIQTGAFLVRDGSIVTPGAPGEISRTNDILHYDDVIITGSLCVGSDCQDGESFGSDTIILKEDNLRIYFNDTSDSASYPTNNWRININDSTNGGAGYFSLDDVDNRTTVFKIEAGAPPNSLYVDDYGRVGLGTSTPVVQLHIKDSDTPTVRLEQDSSGGWPAQTWDVVGNESSLFIRDVTNGAKLPFRIQSDTPGSTLCLQSDGKVGIGTSSPAYPLELECTGTNATFAIERTDGATAKITGGASGVQFGSQTDHPVKLVVNNSTAVMTINTDETLDMSDGGSYDGTWNPASSREYKENIRNLAADEAIAALEGLNPVKFNYKKHKEEEKLGFIAEDVPELVATKGRKNMSTMDIAAVLTKVVQQQQKSLQEQQKTMRDQQKFMQEQQKTIAELKTRIAELEKK